MMLGSKCCVPGIMLEILHYFCSFHFSQQPNEVSGYYCVSLSPPRSRRQKGLKHASGLLRGNAFTRENRVGPRPGRERLRPLLMPSRSEGEMVGHRCPGGSTESPGSLQSKPLELQLPQKPRCLSIPAGPSHWPGEDGLRAEPAGASEQAAGARGWSGWEKRPVRHSLTINNCYKYRYLINSCGAPQLLPPLLVK